MAREKTDEELAKELKDISPFQIVCRQQEHPQERFRFRFWHSVYEDVFARFDVDEDSRMCCIWVRDLGGGEHDVICFRQASEEEIQTLFLEAGIMNGREPHLMSATNKEGSIFKKPKS